MALFWPAYALGALLALCWAAIVFVPSLLKDVIGIGRALREEWPRIKAAAREGWEEGGRGKKGRLPNESR